MERCVGGKGVNAARAFRRLGGRPVVVGFLDSWCVESLRSEGIEVKAQSEPYEVRTAVSVVDCADRSVTELVEEAHPATASALKEVTDAALSCGRKSSFLCLSGSLPQGCPPDTYRRILEACPQAETIVDARGEPLRLSLAAGPFAIKPNREELGDLFGKTAESKSELLTQARQVKKLGARNVVVTCGPEGVLAVLDEGAWFFHAPQVEPVNTTGCGDALLGALVFRLMQGVDMLQALRFAVAAASASACTALPGDLAPGLTSRLVERVSVRAL